MSDDVRGQGCDNVNECYPTNIIDLMTILIYVNG